VIKSVFDRVRRYSQVLRDLACRFDAIVTVDSEPPGTVPQIRKDGVKNDEDEDPRR